MKERYSVMDIQTLKRTSPSKLRLTTTAKGERTIVSCDCGFIYSEEINL